MSAPFAPSAQPAPPRADTPALPDERPSPPVRPPDFSAIVGRAPVMQELFRLLARIVPSDSTVLIQADSGTGKELVARAIHANGPRRDKPFLAHNCSAFTDSLLESTLFGHVKGSFTGAVRDQRGLFEAADGGTFFLDEVGDMSPALQVKLLRLLQEGSFLPVGAERPRTCDVRIIAATHRDLRDLVRRGQFREDLFYRLNVLRVEIPPLRARAEDLPLLCEHFLRALAARRGAGGSGAGAAAAVPRLHADAIDLLAAYGWPGNVRELENEVERLWVMARGEPVIGPEHVSARIRDAVAAARADAAARARVRALPPGGLRAALDALERDILQEGLRRTRGNKSRLAKELGISRSSLLEKVARYGLDRPREE